MEAANRGAFEAGGQSMALNITLPFEQAPNSYITPGMCFNLITLPFGNAFLVES